jgi:hypothetical protein
MPAMAPEPRGAEDVAGAAVVVWALEEVVAVVANVEVDVELVDEEDMLVDEGAAEADEPTRPFAVRLT